MTHIFEVGFILICINIFEDLTEYYDETPGYSVVWSIMFFQYFFHHFFHILLNRDIAQEHIFGVDFTVDNRFLCVYGEGPRGGSEQFDVATGSELTTQSSTTRRVNYCALMRTQGGTFACCRQAFSRWINFFYVYTCTIRWTSRRSKE